MTAAMGMVFAACEPTLIDGPEPFAPVEATVLANGITYQQFADEACTQPDDAGNFLKYNSAAGVVQVFQEGSNSPLYTGAGGVVKIPVKRGQEPSANLVFRLINGDGTFTEAVKTFACTPPTELTQDMLFVVSDNGKKVWKYSLTEPWGNASYNAADGSGFISPEIANKWWGCPTPDELNGQKQHIGGGVPTGDEANGAYMVFTEDGVVSTYDPTGQEIRSGKFEIKDYDPARSSKWGIGKLVTSVPATLFPWPINESKVGVTEFDIMYLTPQNMTLAYVAPGTGDWEGITWWRFVAGSPDPLTMSGTWTYAPGVSWGNAGKMDSGSGYNAPGVVDGKWWGPDDANGLAGQLGHVAGGVATGDESVDAYMVFEDNNVTTYAPDGTKVRGGTWEAVMNDFVSGAGRGSTGWELGKLNTSEPALLFPWSINENGKGVTSYDIMYYDAYNMTLVYTKGSSAGGEITFWNFVRK